MAHYNIILFPLNPRSVLCVRSSPVGPQVLDTRCVSRETRIRRVRSPSVVDDLPDSCLRTSVFAVTEIKSGVVQMVAVKTQGEYPEGRGSEVRWRCDSGLVKRGVCLGSDSEGTNFRKGQRDTGTPSRRDETVERSEKHTVAGECGWRVRGLYKRTQSSRECERRRRRTGRRVEG